jgi:TonB family protein
MFLEYFRLREQPFGVTPDPRYLFPGPAHREALASLIYGIESNLGFGSLIAEPGMGKTTLLFHILEQYRHSARTAFIFNTQCSSHDLLRSLLSEVDEEAAPRDAFQLHERFKQILAAEAKASRRVILIIDEAQNLGEVVMETVRLLSNFESAEFKLLHIILAGQPQLAEKLARSELSQLQQRIPILNHLERLSSEEITAYIEHRLQVAGYRGRPLFTPEALRQIAKLSRGVPREINRLCFNSLSLACASSRDMVDLPVLEEVAADLDLRPLLARDKAQDVSPVSQASEKSVFASTARTVGTPRYGEIPVKEAPRRPPLPAMAPSIKANSRAIAHAHRNRSSRKTRGIKGSFPVYRWPVRRRPVAFGLLYLTLIAAGWSAVNRWARPNSSAGAGQSRDSQPMAQPSYADAKPVSELNAGGAPPSRSKNADRGPGSSTARQVGATSDPPATRPTSENFSAEPEDSQAIRHGSQSPSRWTSSPPNGSRPQVLPSGQTKQPAAKHSAASADRAPSISTPAQPELVRYVPPRYPDRARDRHIEGTVVLNALVARDGTIKTLKAISGDPALLNAAESAVRGWVYRPYKVNGRPVEIDTEIVISFSLTEDHNL